MTTASEPPDPSQNIDEFLKIHWLQLEIDALKLAKVYSLDLNELLSRTQVTMIAVGTALAGGPPRRSQRALLTHWAPASGGGVEAHVGEGMPHAGGW